MLFFLRKLIESLLLPLGASGLLILAGIFLRRRWLALAGVGVLFVFSLLPVGGLLLRPLEHVYSPMTVDAAPHADAIVVLSGGIFRFRNAPGVQWGNSANRFFAGIDLARAGKADLLILSSGLDPIQGPILRQVALDDGLPPDRVVLTSLVSTTQDEARAVSRMPGIHSVLLVTSAFHMPRAAFLFRARGLQVTPFPTDQRVAGHIVLHATELIPSSAGLDDSDAAIREYFGLAVYHSLLFFRAQ